MLSAHKFAQPLLERCKSGNGLERMYTNDFVKLSTTFQSSIGVCEYFQLPRTVFLQHESRIQHFEIKFVIFVVFIFVLLKYRGIHLSWYPKYVTSGGLASTSGSVA